jgi:hypothetical protein
MIMFSSLRESAIKARPSDPRGRSPPSGPVSILSGLTGSRTLPGPYTESRSSLALRTLSRSSMGKVVSGSGFSSRVTSWSTNCPKYVNPAGVLRGELSASRFGSTMGPVLAPPHGAGVHAP